MPAIGETAPDFELLNQDSQSVRLKKYRGHKVILFAFPQANTPNCTAQVCGFRDQFPQIETSGAVILGISPDKPDTLKPGKMTTNFNMTCSPTPIIIYSMSGMHGESQC